MTALKFAIVQHDAKIIIVDREGRYGVLTPVNMDGFYRTQEDAEDVAAFMAQMRPDLETLVVSVVRKVPA